MNSGPLERYHELKSHQVGQLRCAPASTPCCVVAWKRVCVQRCAGRVPGRKRAGRLRCLPLCPPCLSTARVLHPLLLRGKCCVHLLLLLLPPPLVLRCRRRRGRSRLLLHGACRSGSCCSSADCAERLPSSCAQGTVGAGLPIIATLQVGAGTVGNGGLAASRAWELQRNSRKQAVCLLRTSCACKQHGRAQKQGAASRLWSPPSLTPLSSHSVMRVACAAPDWLWRPHPAHRGHLLGHPLLHLQQLWRCAALLPLLVLAAHACGGCVDDSLFRHSPCVWGGGGGVGGLGAH